MELKYYILDINEQYENIFAQRLADCGAENKGVSVRHIECPDSNTGRRGVLYKSGWNNSWHDFGGLKYEADSRF